MFTSLPFQFSWNTNFEHTDHITKKIHTEVFIVFRNRWIDSITWPARYEKISEILSKKNAITSNTEPFIFSNYFSPVLHFLQKPIIWSALQIKWLFSIKNIFYDKMDLRLLFFSSHFMILYLLHFQLPLKICQERKSTRKKEEN